MLSFPSESGSGFRILTVVVENFFFLRELPLLSAMHNGVDTLRVVGIKDALRHSMIG